jgi:hypothetical protein
MKITLSESELYHHKEIYFTPKDLNGIEHEFWLCVQKRKDVPEAELYWLVTYKSTEQICNAVQNGQNLQKFFHKKQVEYILKSIQEGLTFLQDRKG